MPNIVSKLQIGILKNVAELRMVRLLKGHQFVICQITQAQTETETEAVRSH